MANNWHPWLPKRRDGPHCGGTTAISVMKSRRLIASPRLRISIFKAKDIDIIVLH